MFANFKYLVNFVGFCSVIDYVVVWLKLMEKKKYNNNKTKIILKFILFVPGKCLNRN